jgi:hypothetical protein
VPRGEPQDRQGFALTTGGYRRIRTGDARIVYRINGTEIILVVCVGARRDDEVYDAAYKKGVNPDPPRWVFLRLTINQQYGHYGAMRALRKFRGLPAILEAQGTEAAERCIARRSETLPTWLSPQPIMGISRHAHYQCNQSWAGTIAWQGFPRIRTENYLGYLFPMAHHENRSATLGGGSLVAARLAAGRWCSGVCPYSVACLLRAGQKQRACIAASPCFAWCGTKSRKSFNYLIYSPFIYM